MYASSRNRILENQYVIPEQVLSRKIEISWILSFRGNDTFLTLHAKKSGIKRGQVLPEFREDPALNASLTLVSLDLFELGVHDVFVGTLSRTRTLCAGLRSFAGPC